MGKDVISMDFNTKNNTSGQTIITVVANNFLETDLRMSCGSAHIPRISNQVQLVVEIRSLAPGGRASTSCS